MDFILDIKDEGEAALVESILGSGTRGTRAYLGAILESDKSEINKFVTKLSEICKIEYAIWRGSVLPTLQIFVSDATAFAAFLRPPEDEVVGVTDDDEHSIQSWFKIAVVPRLNIIKNMRLVLHDTQSDHMPRGLFVVIGPPQSPIINHYWLKLVPAFPDTLGTDIHINVFVLVVRGTIDEAMASASSSSPPLVGVTFLFDNGAEYDPKTIKRRKRARARKKKRKAKKKICG